MDTKQWLRQAVAEEDPGDETIEDLRERPTSGYILRDAKTGIDVREATEREAPEIAAIGARAFLHSYAAVVHLVDWLGGAVAELDEAHVRQVLRSEDDRCLVALWSGSPVGFAHLRRTRAHMDLRTLVVAPDWSGLGVGSSLVEAACRLSTELGYRRLRAHVWEGNRNALRFFASNGFAADGHEVMVLGKKSTAPAIVLTRALAD